MKPSNRIFFFFLSLPLLACHSVTHFKVPTVSVIHPSALFPAHLWGVRHSKSAHQAPSITMPGKSGTAKQSSFEVPPQALLSVAFIHHFPSVPHSTGRLQKSTVFSFRGELPDLSISHPRVFSARQSGRATYWSPSKSKPLSACKLTETHRCSPLPPLAAILPPYTPSTLPPNLPKPIHCMNDRDWCFRSRCYWVRALTKPSVNWRPSVGNFSAGWWFGTLG